MLESMTIDQFYEWMRYGRLEPFGFVGADMFAARQVWATFKSFAGSHWKGEPQDFLIDKRPEAMVEVDPVEYLKAVLGPGEERTEVEATTLDQEEGKEESPDAADA